MQHAPHRKAILNTGIWYGILRRHGNSAQDHRRGAAGASRKSATSQRFRHHPDRSYGPAASCGIAGLREATPTPGQGSLLASISRSEGRPMIAVDTSTWIAFLRGDA